jgi:hypothetical protein
VLAELRAWPEFEDAKDVVKDFEDLLADDLRLYIQAIDGVWLPPSRARLAGDLVEQRLAWLKRIL